MGTGTVLKTIDLFIDTLNNMGASVAMLEIERMATLVDKAMNLQARHYHTPEHIFNLAEASSSIQALAALFHDVVYTQVDMGFIEEIQKIIERYINIDNQGIYLSPEIDPLERAVWIVINVFGYKPGQKLPPFNGQNEFLSALVMGKCLEKYISESDLLRVAACIEVTIPFRAKDEFGENCMDWLRKRITDINAAYQLNLSEELIRKTIQEAAIFSNKDVSNFSEEDAGRFLDNTWKLLPEMNSSLRTGNVYSIKEYRIAIQKMEAFFSNLNPDTVFYSYMNVPSDHEMKIMHHYAYQNIMIAREYLGIKLLAIAIIEALANLTGGDAPIALFVGGNKAIDQEVKELEDFLPKLNTPSNIDENSPIFHLLDSGRASEINFDTKNSPLALFIYKTIDSDTIQKLVCHAKKMFTEELSPDKFLDMFGSPVVSAIAKASASLAKTRRDALQRFIY